MINKHFLGVGIDKYPNEWEWLEGCENDVEDWYCLLKNNFEFKKIQNHLINNEATYDNILDGFKALLKKLEKTDSIGVFLFSGHGTTRDTQSYFSEGDDKDEMIKTMDTLKSISDDDFRSAIESNPIKGTLICIFDSCFSETMIDLQESKVRLFESKNNDLREKESFTRIKTTNRIYSSSNGDKNERFKSNRVFRSIRNNEILLAASGETQKAYEYDFGQPNKELWNGVFTRLAIDIVKDYLSNNEKLTYGELLNEIERKLKKDCKSKPERNYACKQDPKIHPINDVYTKEIFTI